MTFSDPIARTVITAEVVTDSAQIEGEARRAADRLNRAFNLGAGDAAVKTNQAFNRVFSGLQGQLKNVTSGFQFLGNVIAARLPAQVTNAANLIATRMGNALGVVSQAFGRLSSTASSVWNVVASGAQAAAIAIGALVGITAVVVSNFARIADETQGAEISLRALAGSMGVTNEEATGLINNMRELGSQLGVSSNELINTSQRFIAMGVSAGDTAKLLETVATGAARNNASQAQLSRTLVGLQQVQAKGVLSQQEFRQQILENIPGLLNQNRVFEIMAQKMGVTTDKVRELQEQGKITAAVALPAIQQAIGELNEGVDVLGIRMSTLSGAVAVLRENFNQIVGSSFKPFIDALLPTIKAFIDGLKSGTGPLGTIAKDLGRLGEVAGTAFGDILEEIIPLVAQWFPTFVTLVEAFAPVIVEIVRTFATFAKLIQPVVNFLANILNILFTKLGPVSELLQQLAAGLLAGGLVKALGLAGRALGSFGGFIGRIATPLSNFLARLVPLAGRLSGLVALFGLLKGPIELFINLIQGAIDKVSDFVGWLGRLPGIKQITGLIGDAAGAIGDLIDNADDAPEAIEKIGTSAKEAAEAFTTNFGKINDVLRSVIDDQETLIRAQEKVNDAIDDATEAQNNLKEAQKDLADSQKELVEAHEDLAEAEEELIDIDEELAVLMAERSRLINDVTSDIRELAQAERELERINLRLVDLDRDRAEILDEIAELSRPATAEEMARADLKVARATDELNDAKRREAELLEELEESRQGAIDLSGLSLDDLRTTLAGMRSQAAAQRAVARNTRSEEEILSDLADVKLDIREGEIELNEALTEREELNNRALINAGEIKKLNDDIRKIDLDRLDLLDDQKVKIGEIDGLLRGETTRAGDLKKVNEDIDRIEGQRRDKVNEIKTATETIRDAEDQIRVDTEAIQTASREIKEKNDAIRDAKRQQAIDTATIKGDQETLNGLLLTQIGHNNTIIGQGSQIAANLLAAQLLQNPEIMNALFPPLKNTPGPGFGLRQYENFNPSAQGIADIILNNPNKLRELLRSLGVTGFAEGGMITHPMLATIGEGFKHEMVLPLSRPDRVWSLLSQNLPKYPGALRAAQEALAGPSFGSLPKVVSSGNRVARKDDGPATFGQIQELITLLREKKFEQHVEAPINVHGSTIDEDLLTKKVSRKLERDILDQLRRR